MSKFEIGDIVWVKEFDNEGESKVNSHLFVIIDDDGKAVPMEYFGLVVSSKINKSKTNSPFKFNEPISKNGKNNLKTDSIVKCDQVYEIPHHNINCKIGTADIEDLIRFLEAYNNYIDENKD